MSKFLVFEGVDGSGKGTLIKSICKMFDEKGEKYISIRDPGSTEIGEEIRNIILNPKFEEMGRETELLLYVAARAQMTIEHIIPALKNNVHIICDRYDLSTLTYQYVMGKWGNFDAINSAHKVISSFPRPDWYFVLDVPLDVSKQRLGSSLDRQEKRLDDTFEKIREMYKHYSIVWDNVTIHDASGTPEDVFENIAKVINMMMDW